MHMNEIDRVEQLIRTQNIIGQTGEIVFSYAGFQTVTTSKDLIGNTIQDWFGQWLSANGITWRSGAHSQSWPDFIFSDDSHLEVKAFDSEAGPNFDVANFDAFARSLWDGNVRRLDTMHLIFSYRTDPRTGKIQIDNYWMKKIWEITGPSRTNILNIQKKQNKAVNIRPKNWRSSRVKLFTNRKEFVYALSQAIEIFSPGEFPDWYSVVENHYLNKFNRSL